MPVPERAPQPAAPAAPEAPRDDDGGQRPLPRGLEPLAGRRLVLGVSGSIAAYKAPDLLRLLVRAGAEVQPVLTAAAARFVTPLTLSTLAGREALQAIFPDTGADTWTRHVELGLWADGVVVAPASAQTLARLAGGFCDTMLDAVVLSARCPVLVAPAMDHDMWRHPATQANVARLEGFGYTVVPPARGPLASGLSGDGRLPEPEALVPRIAAWLAANPRRTPPDDPGGNPAHGDPARDKPASGPLAGRHVLVTAGPTREALDPVRFLSNGSTGTMGFALAAAAARRGARVTLVAGPVALPTPPGVDRRNVTSADEMLAAALAAADADLVIAAAAVSDYAPAEPSARKLKKTDDDLVLRLRRTPDVLATLGRQKRDGQTLVGFALETHDAEAHARDKLARKRLDWIAVNVAGEEGAGFGTGTNRLVLLSAEGRRVDLGKAPKTALADAMLDAVLAQPAG
ncbi:MAG: bifunctional phosphopantothenoylcysteine decarboxylase/phosphopantothenate synthase [Rubricoccaceae bacterium]